MHSTVHNRRKSIVVLRGAAYVALAFALSAPIAGAQGHTARQRAVQEQQRARSGPGGWFGVTVNYSGILDEQGSPFFDGYPIVNSVEPGSPAEKAGVKSGDVLITFNDHDMKGSALALRDWLQPGSSFVVRLRRDGASKQVRGVVGKRPPGFGERVTLIWRSPAEGSELDAFGAPTVRSHNMNVVVRTPLPAKMPPVLLNSFSFGGGVYPFAGAEFTALNRDLSDALGVKLEGVFVTTVVPGSPARLAGLRGGDVVLTADSIRLDDPMALVRAIRESNDRSIRLEIVRKKKTQTILLKW